MGLELTSSDKILPLHMETIEQMSTRHFNLRTIFTWFIIAKSQLNSICITLLGLG